MRNTIQLYTAALSVLLSMSHCSKSGFLDEKPRTDILVPSTLNDFQSLLDNTLVFNFTGGLAQLSADDYIVSDANWSGASATQRNAYIWASDIYEGDMAIKDWNDLYQQVYYANAVLDGLAKSTEAETSLGQYLKGWALFNRAYAFYDLTRNFCKAYDASSAGTDLGIPIRLSPNIDYLQERATLQQSFDQILGDLSIAETLLPSERPSANLNRPSKIAVYALLARIYLDMRNYEIAESNADKSLELYDMIIDYNTVSRTSATPFSTTNDELIYNSRQSTGYAAFTAALASSAARVSSELIGLYATNDLRMPIYYDSTTDGGYRKKRGYYGSGNYPFTGLATDEVYLIKAECLVRRGETNMAMERLNRLLVNRWNPKATTPAVPYENITASDANNALDKILLERRKELVWRGLRWHDLKRLNQGGANITLTRTLNKTTYTLAPNDMRWVFPIPDNEIALSGIQQNLRQ